MDETLQFSAFWTLPQQNPTRKRQILSHDKGIRRHLAPPSACVRLAEKPPPDMREFGPYGLAGRCSRWFAHGLMHLRLTEPELATLIEMVSLAADVAAWNQKPGSQEKLSAFEELEAKLLDKAAHSGMGEVIEFDAERQRLRMKQGAEPPFFYQECYDEFRNESFWEELAIRLSDRDLARSIGHKAWSALSEEERRARTPNQEKRYWEEFTKHGVDRVVVLTPPEEG